MAGSTSTDPRTGLSVRPTDNGAKEGDSYAECQDPRMLHTAPDGRPYENAAPDGQE